MDCLFYVFFAAIFLYLAYQVVSKGGLKGAALGAKIERTIGEIPIDNVGSGKRILRIHVLENGNIGFELTAKSLLAYSMTGFALTKQQSAQLISNLRQAGNA